MILVHNPGQLRLTLDLDEQAELRMLLGRALNCLPPAQWPIWVKDLEESLERSVGVQADQRSN